MGLRHAARKSKSASKRGREIVLLLPLLAGLSCLTAERAEARLYPKQFDWTEFRSANMRVFYPSGYDSYARVLASSGLASLDSLEQWYGVRLNVARMVLNPGMDRSEAQAVIGPSRVELSLSPVLEKGLRPQSSIYLDRVTAHEVTHLYQMNLRNGWTRYLGPLFGEALAPAALAPDWLLEGQAIWSESAGGGGRLYSSFQNMEMRTQLAQTGHFWTLSQIAVPGRVHPTLDRAYTGGGFLYSSLASEYYGYNNIRLWMKHQAAWPGLVGWNFDRVYNDRGLGNQWTALESAWREQLRNRMKRRSLEGYAVGEPVLDARRTSYRHPHWTLDGNLVVAERSYDHPDRLLQVSLGPEPQVEELAETGTTEHDGLALFLDGVIVSEVRRGTWAPESTRSVLVRVTRDGRLSELAEGGLAGWAPAFCAETMRLAYIAPFPEGGLGLWTAQLNMRGEIEGRPQEVLHTRLGHLTDPCWSRDGRDLAFAADMGQGEAVYVLDMNGDGLTRYRIAETAATWDPAFAPDGKLWVSADREGIFDLFEIDPATGGGTQQTRVISGAMEPSVSNDGSRIAYSHYTAQGFNLALLDSSRWLGYPVKVRVTKLNRTGFSTPDTLLAQEMIGTFWSYNPFSHLLPNYSLPSYSNGDEIGVGLGVYGRDPVGLLSWRVTGRIGLESSMLDLSGDATYRELPVDVNAAVLSYPDQLNEVSRAQDAGGSPQYLAGTRWVREWDAGVTAFQPFNFDRGPWWTTAVPYAGVVSRFRHRQTLLEDGLTPRSYLGLRLGGTLARAYGAYRDPVPGHLESVWLNGERGIEGMDLNGDLLEGGFRFHIPGPLTSTVSALQAAAQVRNGELDFSRARVRPRGYADDDLPYALRVNGRMLLAGGEYHFPLLFPDHGIIDAGAVFLERVNGSLFVEGATGWGGGLSPGDWIHDYGVASFGGALDVTGWLMYQAETQVEVGLAYRTFHEDTALYVQLSFPELYSFVNEAPGWRQLVRETRTTSGLR